MKALPKGKAKNSSAAQGLTYCKLLFKIEEGLADLPPEERYDQRLKQAKPVLDALLAWANTKIAAPKSSLGKALSYLKEQRPYLLNYLKDGRLELSNKRAERSIKLLSLTERITCLSTRPAVLRAERRSSPSYRPPLRIG